jgi:uncharacterized protein (DUF2147 family)
MAKRVPSETRRLTRAEASRLGVSYGAKRRVSKSVKHVTRKTVLYTDRQVATAKLRAKTGNKKATRESAHKANVETRTLKKGGEVIEYKNLTAQNLHKMLRKYRDKQVILHFKGGGSAAMYDGKHLAAGQWVSGADRIYARELLDPHNFDQYLEDSRIEEASAFGLIVYL